jgi:hypothetical protein
MTKILCAFLISPMRATCPVHLILPDLIPLKYLVTVQIMKFLIVQFSLASCISSLRVSYRLCERSKPVVFCFANELRSTKTTLSSAFKKKPIYMIKSKNVHLPTTINIFNQFIFQYLNQLRVRSQLLCVFFLCLSVQARNCFEISGQQVLLESRGGLRGVFRSSVTHFAST